jgi:hypothetical protein
LPYVLLMMALYLHLGPFSRHVIAQLQRQIDNLTDAQPAAPTSRLERFAALAGALSCATSSRAGAS